jgi:MFS transporter, MHS family, proline/betaine transporter
MSAHPETQSSQHSTPNLRQIILMGLIGNVVEWYDFALYGYFAGILGKLFFPSSDPSISLIASFGAFASGFLMRPIGGLVFGRIGDAIGRNAAMSLSVLVMALPTVLMAILPTHEQIGIWAPIFLILLRIIQGLSVGGEYTSSLVYLAENAPQNRKAFTAIWGSWGAVLGMLTGSGVGLATASYLSPENLDQWGWRIPFALGGLIALTGWWIRKKLPPEPQGPSLKSPVKDVITHYRSHVARVVLINIGYGVAYYTVFVYAVTYIRNIDHFSESVALELNTLSMLVLLLMLPFTAWLSDQLGRRKMVTISMSLLLFASFPLFHLIHMESESPVFIGEILFALLVAMTSGGMVALNVELFPSQIRCTGLALAYNIAHGIFGGTTPLVAAWLLRETGNPIAPVYWLIGALTLSALTLVLWIRDHHLHPVDAEQKT